MSAQLLAGVPHADYHLDRIEGHPGPHFSRSVAVRILHQSPLHAYQAHPLLGGQSDDEPSDLMDKGALIHSMILGTGPEIVPVYVHANKAKIGPTVPALDWRKDEAQEIRDAARAAGMLPVLPHIFEECSVAAAAIRTRLLDFEIVVGEPREAEVTALWHESGPLGEIAPCKARLDLYPGGNWIGDLKVQRNLNVSSFEWSVKKLGLDIQSAMYLRAIYAKHQEIAGRGVFEWILVERKPPYDIALIPASESILSLGDKRTDRALRTWRECLASGRWPGTGRLPALQARPYDLEQEMMAEYSKPTEPTSW